MNKKLYIETVGCQMNVLDSELVVGTLRRQGYVITHEPDDADVIFFNTCSVRQHARVRSGLSCAAARPSNMQRKICFALADFRCYLTMRGTSQQILSVSIRARRCRRCSLSRAM